MYSVCSNQIFKYLQPLSMASLINSYVIGIVIGHFWHEYSEEVMLRLRRSDSITVVSSVVWIKLISFGIIIRSRHCRKPYLFLHLFFNLPIFLHWTKAELCVDLPTCIRLLIIFVSFSSHYRPKKIVFCKQVYFKQVEVVLLASTIPLFDKPLKFYLMYHNYYW